jgi:LmbE family N-acetylglucosaminyl deacetylase
MGARCIGLTIFAAPPRQDVALSPFAQRLHDEWQRADRENVATVNEMRREEERAALRLLGLEPIWLDFQDAPYRTDSVGKHLYGDESLNGRVAAWEKREVALRIASEVRRVARETDVKGPVRVFAPLGVGTHVDHQLVFRAARHLPPRYGVLYYEDYPYSGRPGALEARLLYLRRAKLELEARSTQITDLIGVKIAAITRYKSQLPILFGSSEAMPGAVRAYSQAVAGGAGYAERFWHAPPAYAMA